MKYDLALADFQNKNHEHLISSVLEFMEDEWENVTASAELIKLMDIALRSALMSQDYAAFDEMISRCGHTSALSHFMAAKHFNDGQHELAWFALSNSSQHVAAHHGFWSLGLNSLVRDAGWHVQFSRYKNDIGNKVSDLSVDRRYDGHLLESKKYVVVFSSDAGYFKRFFQYSLGSLRDNCENYFAVYHIINPDSKCMELIEAYSGTDVGFSFETRNITKVEKSYYASRRFFIAKQVLELAGLPTFVLDIDTCLKKDLFDLFEGNNDGFWSKTKVGLKISTAMELPWQKIAAGAVFLPPANEGIEFISKVCDYLDHVYSRTGPQELWWIDQNALFFAYLESDSSLFQRWTGVLLHAYLSYPKLFVDKDKYFENAQRWAKASKVTGGACQPTD